MCGIATIIGPQACNSIDVVTDAMIHRGPDGRGIWRDESRRIAMGHRRLSIIDTSSGGHQPMVSADQRWVLVFNGEIYNFQQLSGRLADHPFRSSSDTEVLLELFAKIGVESTLQATNGMFALSLFDRQNDELHLARDRMGEKPLYFGNQAGHILIASEPKAFLRLPGFRGKIDLQALELYLKYNYIPAPYCIYQGIQKLQPGCWCTVKLDENGNGKIGQQQTYWDLAEVASEGLANPIDLNDDQAIDALEQQLLSSVSSRMFSDVPLGAFLSGGYDSTAVVAAMQQISTSPVKTFTIGMGDSDLDESNHARAVADHLKTDHTEHRIDEADALAIVGQLGQIYCEPFADASQIPTILVSQVARQEVTVALSGDGGDELFGGYNRHFWVPRLWRRMAWMPRILRSLGGGLAQSLSERTWDRILSGLQIPASQAGEKLHKVAAVAGCRSALAMYRQLTCINADPKSLLRSPDLEWKEPYPKSIAGSLVDQMMYLDSKRYLPGDILHKVDRASMSTSLEARVPMLDQEMLAFAWRLPAQMKVRGGEGKWILKQLVHRWVPSSIMQRPKMGFRIPLGDWLRGPLKEWASELLNFDRIKSEGHFHAAGVKQLWDQHQTGQRQWELQLWSLLMFQHWKN